MKPELIMLVGLPACGKSTYAETLKEKGYRIHSPDALREDLLNDVNRQDKNTDIFAELTRRIKADLSNGYSCVYDATNMNKKYRIALLNEIKKIDCKKTCVLFVVPVSVCKERNQSRERKVPDEVYDKMLKSFWCPYYYEGWDEIRIEWHKEQFIEDWSMKYSESIRDMPQDNPHHRLTLGEHLQATGRYILDKYYGKYCLSSVYSVAAYYHDIGKILTKTFTNYKGEKTDIAHYYGHENYGAYMTLVLYCSDLFVTKDIEELKRDERYIIETATLINWHMRPYVWEQSEKARKRDKMLIGEGLYDWIMRIHEADVAAH